MKDDVTEFMMDPLSGEIKTVAELDYERSGEPRLVVGTEQAMLAGTLTDTSTATVILSVSDPGSPSLQTRVEMRVVVEQVVTLPSNTMDSHAINIQGARLMMRADIFLKIFPSVKLEIFRLVLISASFSVQTTPPPPWSVSDKASARLFLLPARLM